jgi:hypothetical protein
MKAYLLTFLSAIAITNCVFNFIEDYSEITNEQYTAFQVKYIEEKDPDAKAHYNAILRPELFDKNKDRKISRNEIYDAILYLIYPKADSKRVDIPKEIDRHVKSQVELFVNNLKYDYLNFKQFSALLMKISANNFIHAEMVRRSHEAKMKQLDESEGEL